MSLRDQLQEIYNSHKQLTPELVVAEARDQAHPLHSRFEWNDAIAGEKFRHIQAGELIRSVRIKYKQPGSDEERDVRAFHVVPRGEGHTYVPVEDVAQDEIGKAILLGQMERDWRAFKRRYEHLSEFLDLLRGEMGTAA